MPADVLKKNSLFRSIGRNLKSRRSRGNLKDFAAAGRNTSKARFSPARWTIRKDSERTLILLKNIIRERRELKRKSPRMLRRTSRPRDVDFLRSETITMLSIGSTGSSTRLCWMSRPGANLQMSRKTED